MTLNTLRGDCFKWRAIHCLLVYCFIVKIEESDWFSIDVCFSPWSYILTWYKIRQDCTTSSPISFLFCIKKKNVCTVYVIFPLFSLNMYLQKTVLFAVNILIILKTLDTFGNGETPVFTVGVSQHMHKITNLWKCELSRSSELRDFNERKKKTPLSQHGHTKLSNGWFRDLIF